MYFLVRFHAPNRNYFNPRRVGIWGRHIVFTDVGVGATPILRDPLLKFFWWHVFCFQGHCLSTSILGLKVKLFIIGFSIILLQE